jgi:hypothetical protein
MAIAIAALLSKRDDGGIAANESPRHAHIIYRRTECHPSAA